jgi:hypothetical protein
MERATSGRSPATGNQVTRPARGEHQARGPESPETCSANRGVLPLRREGAGRRPAGRSGASRPGIEPGGCTSASTSICEDVAMLSRGGAPSGASSAVKIRPLRNLTVDSRTPAAGARPNRSTPWEDFPARRGPGIPPPRPSVLRRVTIGARPNRSLSAMDFSLGRPADAGARHLAGLSMG